jgi:DNA repair protein RadC
MLPPMPAKPSHPDEPPSETPHYHGHRTRLRERFRGAGADALSDYELPEMVLFRALPRGDVKPLAKSLIKTFGSFAEVVHAPPTRLREVDGVGEATITELKLIAAAANRVAKGQVEQRTMLSSWNEVLDYCRTSMVSKDNIVFAHLGTNASNSDDGLKSQIGESICDRASCSARKVFFMTNSLYPRGPGSKTLDRMAEQIGSCAL